MLKLRDIHWHRGIARNRNVMFAVGIVAPVLVVVAAYFIGRFVRWDSANDVLNYVLMIGHVVACVVSGWLLGMVATSWILGESWRVNYLAGKAYSEGDAVDRMMSEGNDRSPLFVGISAVSVLVIYVASVVVGGNFLSNYDRFAEPMTALRGNDATIQIQGLEMIARDLEYDENEILAIREQIVEKLGSSNEKVQARAAWAAGQLGVAASRDQLTALLGSPSNEVKISSAIALARLHVPGVIERLVDSFPAAGGDPGVEQAWIAALGLTQDESVGAFVHQRFDQLHPGSLAVAYWAIGMSGDVCLAGFLIEESVHAPSDDVRCVIGDALKRTSVARDIRTIQSWVTPERDHWCLRQLIAGPAIESLGSRDAVILAGQESLREKHMDAVFNTAADGVIDWYDAILRDDGYPNTAREHAYFLMQTIRKTPSRRIRDANHCDEDDEGTQQFPVQLRHIDDERDAPEEAGDTDDFPTTNPQTDDQ